MELSRTIKLLLICRLVPNREPWYKARSSQSYESMGAIQVMNVHNWIGKMYNTCYCHWFTYWFKELRCDDPNSSHWYLAGSLHVVSPLRLIDCRSKAKITQTFGVPATLLDRGWLPMTPVRQRTRALVSRSCVAYRVTPPPRRGLPIITWLSHGLWSGAVPRL